MPTAAPPAFDPAAAGLATPPSSSLGGLGGGGAPAGGSGFGQQLADLIGSLFGSAGGIGDLGGPDESLADPVEDRLEDPVGDEDDEDEKLDDDASTEDEDTDATVEDVDEATDPEVEPAATAPEVAEDPAVAPPPEAITPPPPPPPPVDQPLAAPAVSDEVGPTPCEIAADELPQVGEQLPG